MRLNAQRLGLLFAAGLLISVAMVACSSQAPTPSSYNPSSNNSGNVFHTPNPNANSPTPTFPGFTVGAWPSNYSPNNNDTITIYVICRVQDTSMQQPPKPAQGVSVVVTFTPEGPGVPGFQTLTAQTGADGIAALTMTVNDPASGVPIVVNVEATYAGNAYVAQTFFTPNPGTSASPSACASPGPGTPPTGGGPGGCSGNGH
jgi:hypothetical protein